VQRRPRQANTPEIRPGEPLSTLVIVKDFAGQKCADRAALWHMLPRRFWRLVADVVVDGTTTPISAADQYSCYWEALELQ
jgi:hypothetical protein